MLFRQDHEKIHQRFPGGALRIKSYFSVVSFYAIAIEALVEYAVAVTMFTFVKVSWFMEYTCEMRCSTIVF